MSFIINQEKCVGCGACKYICLFEAPTTVDEAGSKYEIKAENCLDCGQCETICPNNAISPAPDHRRIKRVSIIEEKCSGCGICRHFCLAKAPDGEKKKPFSIDQSKCFKCGVCVSKCRKEAIVAEYN